MEEREQKEKEARDQEEKEMAARIAKIEQEALESEERYQEFLESHGYTTETSKDFLISSSGSADEVKLYKLVGTFKK